MNINLYSNEELNDIAYDEFVKEVHSTVINFEHIVDKKTGMVSFNESNAELLIESIQDFL